MQTKKYELSQKKNNCRRKIKKEKAVELFTKTEKSITKVLQTFPLIVWKQI